LTIDDVVRIKALMPDSLQFDYVDATKLLIDAEAQASAISSSQDIYKVELHESAEHAVLHFEFTDGEIRPNRIRAGEYSPPL